MRDEEGDLEAVRMALDERLGRAPPPAYGRSHMAQLHLGVVQGAHPPETHMHIATTAKAKELQDQYKREFLKAKSIPALGMGTSPAKMKPTKKKSDIHEVRDAQIEVRRLQEERERPNRLKERYKQRVSKGSEGEVIPDDWSGAGQGNKPATNGSSSGSIPGHKPLPCPPAGQGPMRPVTRATLRVNALSMLGIILNNWHRSRIAQLSRGWWLGAQIDKQKWVDSGISIDLGLNDIPKRGERRQAFEAGVKADIAAACGCSLGRIKSLRVADGGQPRSVKFKFGTEMLPGDRSAGELLGTFMAEVMDSSSSLYKGVIACKADRQQTLRLLGHDFMAGPRKPSSDPSAMSPAASLEQAKARRRAADLMANPNPPPPDPVPAGAGLGSTRNVLFAAADIAAQEHARLTSISMGIKQYLKVQQFYRNTTLTRLVGRWLLHHKEHQAATREAALLKLNQETGDSEAKLMATVAERDAEIIMLKQSLQGAESTIQEQKTKLAENALVMMERAELQSELRSTAAGGAELVGDISSKLADVVMALQSQGILFHNKLNQPTNEPPAP